MADTGKRKISAKEIVVDIRSGMDDAQLQRKYGLSDEALESVFDKLMNAGAITESEIRNRVASASHERPEDREGSHAKGTLCPSCNASVPSGSDECPVCGIVLSKFVPSQAETNTSPVEFAHLTHAESEASSRWLSVGLSLVVLALVGVSVVIWAMHRDKQKLQDVLTDTPQALEQAGSPADTSEEAPSEETPAVNKDPDEPTTGDVDEPAPEAGGLQPVEEIKEEPKKQTTHSRPTAQTLPVPPSDKGAYVTGELRRFTARDFKKEVVEASRTYPVIFQFYSDT